MPESQYPGTKSNDILIVDDESSNLQLLCELLGGEGYQVRPTNSPHLAIDSALAQPPSLILLDVRMPEMDGFEVCRRLKQEERVRHIPIIFVSALQDVKDRIRGFESGGVDFITKPFQELEVLARVRTHLDLHNMKVHLEEMVVRRTAELTAVNKALEIEIIERNRTEAALKESRRFTDNLIETANVMIVGLDTKGRITLFNPAAERITGYARAEIQRKNWFEHLVPQERHPEVQREFGCLMDRGTPKLFQNPILTKNGEERVISWNNNAVIANDKVAGVLSFGVDITERLHAEEEVRKGRDYLKRLTDSMADIVISVKMPERTVEWVNKAIEQLGYEPDECIGRSTEFLYADKKDFLSFSESITAALSEGKDVLRSETLLRKKGGGLFPVEVTISFFRINGDLISVTAIARNIEARTKKEKRIREYQKRLKALASQVTIAEEMERRRIAADLHDNVGQSLALARIQIASVCKHATDSRQIAILNQISDALRQTVKETRDLIYDLSPPQLNEIGLSAAISEWLEEHIKKRYDISAECIFNGPDEQLDETLRSILFRNIRELVTNVIKHSQAAQIKIKIHQAKDHINIIVSDDGIGFDADAMSQSLNSEGGFGLFSIRERMADMGGYLEIKSEPGQGTEALLCVPKSSDDAVKGVCHEHFGPFSR
jgi:PAS domain S-box-containing protein